MQLQAIFGDRFSQAEAVRRQHANTLTWLECQPPDAVVFPTSSEEVVKTVDIAGDYGWPIIPFGAGTSLEGHLNAPGGGLSIDFSNMNRVLDVNTGDLDCTVQAGISRAQLNAHLRDTGLFFPVDPGAEEASLGGMAATRASGTCAVRYGTMRENVIRVCAVMADGSVVRTGSRARKSAAGYDLTRLLVGSEGTLGIITELTLKLYGVPERVIAAVVPFRTVGNACDTVMAGVALGLDVARIELLDALQIKVCNAHAQLDLEETPTLFLEFHGSGPGLDAQVAVFEGLAREAGATSFQRAHDADARRLLWKARHEAFWAVREAWPGKSTLVTDVCVPVSRLADCICETEEDVNRTGLVAPIVGHVGDGNFHTICMFDPDNADEVAALSAFSERLAMRAIEMDGTCTGEHGIGQGKASILAREMGRGTDVMRAIKKALDPENLLNPGKIFVDT